MDTITAALCETCPEADRAAWPSGLMCAKAQGADFALTASTFDFSAILQESLDSLPGKETADAEAPFLLPYATGEEPAQDGPDNNLKMQTDGSGNNEADGTAFSVSFPVAFGNADRFFPGEKKSGAALSEAQFHPGPDFPQSVAGTDYRIEQTVLSAKQKASETNDTGLSFPQAAREGKEEAGQAEDSAKGILRQDIIASGGNTSEIFFTAKSSGEAISGTQSNPGREFPFPGFRYAGTVRAKLSTTEARTVKNIFQPVSSPEARLATSSCPNFPDDPIAEVKSIFLNDWPESPAAVLDTSERTGKNVSSAHETETGDDAPRVMPPSFRDDENFVRWTAVANDFAAETKHSHAEEIHEKVTGGAEGENEKNIMNVSSGNSAKEEKSGAVISGTPPVRSREFLSGGFRDMKTALVNSINADTKTAEYSENTSEKNAAGKDFRETQRIAYVRREAERETAPGTEKKEANGLCNFLPDMDSEKENSSEATSGVQPQRSRQSLPPGCRTVETAPVNWSIAEDQTVRNPSQSVTLPEARIAASPAQEMADRSSREAHFVNDKKDRPESPATVAGTVRRTEKADGSAKEPVKGGDTLRSLPSTFSENSSFVHIARGANASAAVEQPSVSAKAKTLGEDAEQFTEKNEAEGTSGEQERMTIFRREAIAEPATGLRKMKAEGKETVLAGSKAPQEKPIHGPGLVGGDGVRASASGNLAGQIIRRVAAQFQEKMNGAGQGGRVKILLAPPSLGMLQMDITVTNSLVRVKLTADNKDAGQALAGNIDTLKAALQLQGLTIDRCDVLLQDRTDAHAQGFREQSFSREGPFRDNSNGFRRDTEEDHLQNLAKTAGSGNRPVTGHPSPGNISLFV